MNGWMNEWMDGWMDEWMDNWLVIVRMEVKEQLLWKKGGEVGKKERKEVSALLGNTSS